MKEIKILLFIILILLVIFGIKISGIKIFNNNEKITIEELKEIASKAKNITNYSCEYSIGFDKKIKFKDNKEIQISNSKDEEYMVWIDYEKDEQILINDEKSIAIISEKSDYSSENIFKNLESILNKSKIEEYEYRGKKEFNGYNCIIAKFINIDPEGKKMEAEIWVDEKSGFIMKEILKQEDEEIEIEYNVKFNCVTDEDVKEPGLSNYSKVVDNRKNK